MLMASTCNLNMLTFNQTIALTYPKVKWLCHAFTGAVKKKKKMC